MNSTAILFFRDFVNFVRAILAGCEIPVVFKPLEGPVHLSGKGGLESLCRPASDSRGGRVKRKKLKATSNHLPFKETNHAKPNR